MNRTRVKLLAAVAIAIGVIPPTAAAATVAETLEAFGFFGTWAVHCDEEASPTNNVRSALVSPTGNAEFSESLGPDSEPNRYVVLKAARVGEDTIVLRTKLNGEIKQELTMRKNDDRLRTMTNRDLATRRYVVRNGKLVSNGPETPWLTRCAAGR